jgi:hypothetical protein
MDFQQIALSLSILNQYTTAGEERESFKYVSGVEGKETVL